MMGETITILRVEYDQMRAQIAAQSAELTALKALVEQLRAEIALLKMDIAVRQVLPPPLKILLVAIRSTFVSNFSDIFRLPLSEGTIDNALKDMSLKAEPAYRKIQARIAKSEVVGADETGCRVNGKKHWFHVWQTKLGHQLCIAHLLRELLNFEKALDNAWCIRMNELFHRALALKKSLTPEDYNHPPEEILTLNKELDGLLKVDTSVFHPKLQALVKRLVKQRESVFRFLTHPDIPADNLLR